MAVSPGFEGMVLDQLSRAVPAVTARRMFGGVGFYSETVFFALIADDTLYFKVDDTTRTEFERRGMEPFRPYGNEGGAMQYFQVPEDVLEDPETLRTWAEGAIGAARRKKQRPSRRRGA